MMKCNNAVMAQEQEGAFCIVAMRRSKGVPPPECQPSRALSTKFCAFHQLHLLIADEFFKLIRCYYKTGFG
jgi:hypothetical protein